MAHNQAVVVLEPHKAGIRDVPYPTLPAEDYMIVRTTAVAINPTDWKHIEFENEWSSEGCQVGFDYAGVVEHVGSEVVKPFKKGDRVAGCAHGTNYLRKSDGAFAKYIVVRAGVQMKTPENLSDVEAASLGVSIYTTALSLYKCLGLPIPSQTAKESFWLFIYGGSTAMGVSAIQYAKLSGAKIVTTSSPANTDYVKSFGADHVLDYKSPTLADDVLKIVGGQLKYALDCHADDASTVLCAKLLNVEGARLTSLLIGKEEVARAANPNIQTYAPLGYAVFGEEFWFGKAIDASPEDYEWGQKTMELSEGLFAEGKLKPPRIFLNQGGSGLEGVLAGLEDLKNGKLSGGKLVYTI